MEPYLKFVTTVDLLISIIFSLLTAYLTIRIISKLFSLSKNNKKTYQPDNLSISIFLGVSVVSAIYLTQASVQPAIDSLRTYISYEGSITFISLLYPFIFFLGFYITSFLISILIVLSSIFIYMKATKDVDEIKEIKDNNITVTVLCVAVILSVSIFVKPSLEHFIGGMVNYNLNQKNTVISN